MPESPSTPSCFAMSVNTYDWPGSSTFGATTRLVAPVGVRKFSGFAKSMEGVAVQENATAPGSAPFLGFSTAAAPTSRSATLDADFSTGARSVHGGHARVHGVHER